MPCCVVQGPRFVCTVDRCQACCIFLEMEQSEARSNFSETSEFPEEEAVDPRIQVGVSSDKKKTNSAIEKHPTKLWIHL